MANRISGITVEIGGDTTKLSSALKSVNSEIRSTQQQLKDVNRLLKLDPGNTDLLVQKQKMLSQAIEETKHKLETLKEAQRQADEALKNGTMTQEQYDALQREIAETTKELEKLEKEAEKCASALGTKLQQAGEKINTVGKKISGVGTTLTRNVTAPIVGLGAAAIKTAGDFDAAMSKVKAVSGATGDEFDRLRAKAREMGAKTKFSASEAAEAMNYMAMAGWKTADMLNGVEGIMNLAAAPGEELATTSDIVTDALTAFGLTAKDSGHFADVLAAASSNANTNVSMMGETFKYCAPIAGALGYSIEDTAEAIGLMANAGIKSSQAGTSLRKIMTELNGEIEISGEKLGEVKIQTSNADGSMRSFKDILNDCRDAFSQLTESEKASTAESLVGKTAMSGFLALMNAGEGDITKLANAIDNCDGKAEEMAGTMQDNLNGQLTILKSQLQELAISFGDILMPAIRELVGKLQGLVDWLNSLDEDTRNMIVKIALIAAAIGPLLVGIGHVVSAIGTITSAVGTLITKFSSLASAAKTAGSVVKTAMTSAASSSGAGAAGGAAAGEAGGALAGIGATIATTIAGIVAVLGGAALAVKNFVDMFKDGFQVIKEILMVLGIAIAAVGAIILGAPALIAAAIAAAVAAIATAVILIKDHFEEIKEFFTNLGQSISEFFTVTLPEKLSGIGEKIGEVFSKIGDAVSPVLDVIKILVVGKFTAIKDDILSVWNWLVETFTPLIEAFQYLFETIFMAIQILVERAMNKISEVVTSIWQAIVDFVSPILQSLHDFILSIFTAIQEFLTPIMEAIKTVVMTAWTAVKETVTSVLTAIKGVVTSVWNEVKAVITNTINAAKAAVSAGFNAMLSAIKPVMSNIVNTIKTGFTNAVNFIKNLIGQARNWGRDLVQGIADGIRSAVGAVADAVRGVADTIRASLHFSVPDEGPLTDYESWMPDFMKGLADGINRSKYLVHDAVKGLAGDMVITPKLNQPQLALADAPQTPQTAQIGLFDEIKSALKDLTQGEQKTIIPVYIGQERIEEIVVNAGRNADFRSGGR